MCAGPELVPGYNSQIRGKNSAGESGWSSLLNLTNIPRTKTCFNTVHLTFESDLLQMEQGRLIWNQMDGESWFDTTIICSDGCIKTNKCFLVFSDIILGCILGVLSPYHQEMILMKQYTTSEVLSITKNFSKAYKASQSLGLPCDERQEASSDIAKTNYNPEDTIQNDECFVEKIDESKSVRTNIEGRSESKVCSDCGKIFGSSKQMKKHK